MYKCPLRHLAPNGSRLACQRRSVHSALSVRSVTFTISFFVTVCSCAKRRKMGQRPGGRMTDRNRNADRRESERTPNFFRFRK